MSPKIPSILKWILFTVAFSMCQFGSSQEDKIAFEKYGVAEGLPEEWPIALLQDEQGFIWFNTQNGLVKYDGYDFKVFKAARNKTGDNQLEAVSGDLFTTKDGKIWIGGISLKLGISSFDPKTEQFKTYKYDGKPSNEITLSKFNLEDEDGNLWLNGISINFENSSLYRFNPEEGQFYFYPSVDINQSFFGVYMNMYQINGELWLLDKVGNLNIWNPVQDSFEIAIPSGSELLFGESRDTVRSFIKNKQNQFIMLGDYGVCIFDAENREVVKRFTDFDTKTFTSNIFWHTIAEDSTDQIWVCLEDGGLMRIDPKTDRIRIFTYGVQPFLYKNDPASTRYWIISFQNDKGIWFQSLGGSNQKELIAHFTFETEKFTFYDESFNLEDNPFSNSYLPYAFFEDKTGLLWLNTRPNLYKQAARKRPMELYRSKKDQTNSLPTDTVTYLYEDSKQRIWVGTSQGLARYNSQSDDFKVFSHEPNKPGSLSDRLVQSITEDRDGHIWIATKNGLNKWDESSGTFKRYFHDEATPQNCYFVYLDKEGQIWVSVLGRGTYVLEPKTGKIIKTFAADNPASLASKTITNIFEDSRGTIWLNDAIDNSFGLYRQNDSKDGFIKIKSTDNGEDSPNSQRILFLTEDGEDNLWIASSSSGISRYDYNLKKIIRYPSTESFAVIAHVKDQNGKLWFWSYSGIGLFTIDIETGELLSYGEELGLLHNDGTLFKIPVDKNGRFWMPTQRGLSVFDPVEKTFTNYFDKDGFQPNSNSYVGLLDSEGDIWIGGLNGLNRIDVEMLFQKDTTIPSVVITKMTINDSAYSAPDGEIFDMAVSYTQTIELKHWQKDVGFEFVGLHFLRSEDNMYSWKMENYDKDWSTPSRQRSVTYTNLSPGTYTFRVKASNADGVWNEEGASIQITILPPWWRTWWAYLFYLLIALLCIYVFIRWRTGVLKKENEILEARVTDRTEELRQSLENLKQTQALLIQSEKMASLGELTAGVAHEIQNPLNFVNNFSEVSQELLEEVEEERAKDPEEVDEDLVSEILQDLKQNLGKINQHGKRADSIVKGMLEHSRVSSGNLSPTDINALADEYLRLSYHGIKAKDQTFNVNFETNFDPTLPLINANQQDLGRVILNLINNAFYACNERSRQSETNQQEYQPQVTVSTKNESGRATISIKDNGTGIPADIKEKIFQPFFTTKPTGQGTGLGLSLSYDIIKAHGGEVLVNSEVGKGTEFIIKIPIMQPGSDV